MNTTYEQLTTSELLQVAIQTDGEGLSDADAVQEILNRQHEGKALRLYPDGRRGPHDNGLIPLSLGNDHGIVVIDVGYSNRSFVIPKERLGPWMHRVAEKLNDIVDELKEKGWDEYRVDEWLYQNATDGFNIGCCIVMNDDAEEGLGVTLYPQEQNFWTLGWRECAQFCRAIIQEADRAGWSRSEIGVTREGIDQISRLFTYSAS